MSDWQGPIVTTSQRSQIMIVFLEGIHRNNYREAVAEKRKQYEVDDWKMCVGEEFSDYKVTHSGRYQITLVRHINGGEGSV